MSPADNTPNFDTMSPEEIIAWMETLAKRQGASEGITTTANVEIPEIDPSSVEIDEPGYVPYGKDPKKWAEEEAARKAEKAAQAPLPRPVTAAPPPPTAAPLRPAPVPPPLRPVAPVPPAAMPKPPQPAPASQNAMSWLESLAADQSGGLPELDLSGLAADITPMTSPSAKQPAANPIDWLESLTQGQEEETQSAAPIPATEAGDPFAEGVDPMSWLETMARRQGVKQEELTTEANVNVPAPQDSPSVEGPGYTPYSFDALGLASRPPEESLPTDLDALEEEAEAVELEDPSAWLDSLASSQGFTPEAVRGVKADKPLTDEDIRSALERGEDIPHDLMERWMSRQLEIGAQRDEPEAEYDPDAPAVPAELPDWLIEQVGSAMPPEDIVSPPPPQQPALIDVISEPPPVANIPDWLRDEAPAESDLDNLFVTAQEELPLSSEFTVQPEVDEHDSWAEALEYERQQDINAVPDWYVQNINDPTRRAVVDRQISGEIIEPEEDLVEAVLQPEAGLPLGQPEEMPDWLTAAAVEAELPDVMPMDDMPDWLRADVSQPAQPVAVIAEPAVDIPDWLQSVDVDDVPDWLKETISPPAPPAEPAPAPVPPQPVVSQPIVPPAPIPAPAPAAPPAPALLVVQPAARVDVSSLLADARGSITTGDVEGGLRHYEALVRANVDLDAVAADLAKLAERYKTNAAIYRVWGDGLMRQGKLQAALDTYRKALNQL